MLDLASAQIAGATMAEISSVLYWTVLQWAGYPKDKKVAHLQLMLERDGKMAEFEKRIAGAREGKDMAADSESATRRRSVRRYRCERAVS